MPINTTDVVTNAVTGVEIINNGSSVVSCINTGVYKVLSSNFETSFSYGDLESKYTNRFDDVYYYVQASGS